MENNSSDIFETVFEKLKQTEKVERLASDDMETWKLITPVVNDSEEAVDICFYILFPAEFPYQIPVIRIEMDDYPELKGKPHIFPSGFICTFDSETAVTNYEEPYGIVIDCLHRSKEIIENGFQNRSTEDYKEEFLPYWTQKYAKKDFVTECLLVADESNLEWNSLTCSLMSTHIGRHDVILYDKSEESKLFLDNLRNLNVSKKKDYVTIYLGTLDIGNPPYDFSNEQIIEIVKNQVDKKVFKKLVTYVNKYYEEPLIILFSVKLNKDTVLLGWKLEHPKMRRNGFRRKNLEPYKVISELDKSKKTHFRISTVPFSRKRQHRRTAGNLKKLEKTVNSLSLSIIGLGSIGSNLLHFLVSTGVQEIRLNDPDVLTVENIGRHLLGMLYVGVKKVKALESYLVKKSPIISVKTKEESIFEIIEKEVSFVNETDFIFVAIGKYNLESYLCQKQSIGWIKKPMFILWVEPYLAGGHCLYLSPNKSVSFADLHENGIYKNNVIATQEYEEENPYLLLKEAGCHTSFTPYSSADIILFLAAIFPKINRIMSAPPENAQTFTWIGNTDLLKELDIECSILGQKYSMGSLIEENFEPVLHD